MNKGGIRTQRYQKLHEMTILKDQRIMALVLAENGTTIFCGLG